PRAARSSTPALAPGMPRGPPGARGAHVVAADLPAAMLACARRADLLLPLVQADPSPARPVSTWPHRAGVIGRPSKSGAQDLGRAGVGAPRIQVTAKAVVKARCTIMNTRARSRASPVITPTMSLHATT